MSKSYISVIHFNMVLGQQNAGSTYSSFSAQGMGGNTSLNKKNRAANIFNFVFSMKGIVLALIMVCSILGFLYYDSKQENEELKGSVAGQSSKEYQEILTAVKSLVNVADNERVNIAKIDNSEDLKKENPVFYKDVVNGHYLIVFPETQRVMIYDKENTKIINFSSYTIQVELIPEEEIDASEKPLNIELRYSSSVSLETVNQVKDLLTKASSNYNFINANPTTQTYEGITVVLLNKKAKPKMSQNIVAHAGTTNVIEELPSGEAGAAEGTDVVIILGNLKNNSTTTSGQ